MSSRSQRDLKSIRQDVRSDKSDTETDFELYLRSLLGVFIGAGDQQKSGVAAHRQHIQGQTRALKKIVDFWWLCYTPNSDVCVCWEKIGAFLNGIALARFGPSSVLRTRWQILILRAGLADLDSLAVTVYDLQAVRCL